MSLDVKQVETIRKAITESRSRAKNGIRFAQERVDQELALLAALEALAQAATSLDKPAASALGRAIEDQRAQLAISERWLHQSRNIEKGYHEPMAAALETALHSIL